MSSQQISADPSACLDVFWSPERAEEAALNTAHQDAVLAEAQGGFGLQQTDDLPDLSEKEIEELCSGPSDTATELGEWTEEVESDGIWPPGVSENHTSLVVGRLVSTRPMVERLCGRDPDDPVERSTYSCSAAAVTTDAGDSLVLTAGHCLHEGGVDDGDFHQDVRFYPGWNGVDYVRGNLGGSYDVVTAGVLSEYVNRGSFIDANQNDDVYESDLAFGVVSRDTSNINQYSLEQNVGGYEVVFEGAIDFQALLQGYPIYPECLEDESPQTHECVEMDVSERDVVDINASPMYRPGHLMVSCDQPVQQGYDGHDLMYVADCGFRGGASGGPWVHGFDDEIDEGIIRGVSVGVNSFGQVLSPHLDGRANDLYDCMVEELDPAGDGSCRDD